MNHKSFRTIHQEAMDLRNELSLGIMDVVDIFKILTIREKVCLIYIPMNASFSGCCISKGPVKVIAINATHNLARRRYTAAHELYHMKFQDNKIQRICLTKFDRKDSQEIEADVFASYFLLLKDSLKQFIHTTLAKRKGEQLGMSDLIQIEQYFAISHSTLLWRLLNEKYINNQQKEQLLVNVRYQSKVLGYDTLLYDIPESPTIRVEGEYVSLVKDALEKGLISQGKYESYLLDIDREDLVYNLNNKENYQDEEADLC